MPRPRPDELPEPAEPLQTVCAPGLRVALLGGFGAMPRLGGHEAQLDGRLANHLTIDHLLLPRITDQQCGVAYHVDQARYASRHREELLASRALEDALSGVARKPQAL